MLNLVKFSFLDPILKISNYITFKKLVNLESLHLSKSFKLNYPGILYKQYVFKVEIGYPN